MLIEGAMRVCVALGCLCSAGCTIVRVEGPARISSAHFGVLRIEPAGESRVLVYSARGFGLIPGREGLTLGAKEETAALVYAPEDCRILLFRPHANDVAVMLGLLKSADVSGKDVCVSGEK